MTLRFVFTNCFRSCTSQNNYDLNVFFDLSSNSCSPWKCWLQNNERFNNNVWFPITCCFDNKLLIQVLASPRTDYSHFIIVHFREWTCFSGNLILRNGFEMGGLVECLRWPSNMFSGNLSNFITKICRQAGVALMMRLKKTHKCWSLKKGIVRSELNEPSG